MSNKYVQETCILKQERVWALLVIILHVLHDCRVVKALRRLSRNSSPLSTHVKFGPHPTFTYIGGPLSRQVPILFVVNNPHGMLDNIPLRSIAAKAHDAYTLKNLLQNLLWR